MIRAILVDDERLALDKLSRMLEESGMVEIVGAYQTPTNAFEAVSQDMCDIVFLDIHMSQINGLELADKFLQMNGELTIVFVTAYDEYALDAFEVNALDYLLKPVKRDRLQKTLTRIQKQSRRPTYETNLQVICFGGFRVRTNSADDHDMKWRTSKAEELFAFLIHHAQTPLTRDEIIDQIWGEEHSNKAVSHFHTTLYYVRKALANAGIAGLIQQDKSFYSLDVSKIHCDRYEFERLVPTVGALTEHADLPLLEHVVSLHQGKYMGERSYAWAEQVKMHLEQRYVHALIQLSDAYQELKRYSAAEERLRQALKYYPMNERIHERLIYVYLLQHDRIAALKQYDSLRRRLKAEYGVEPWNSVKDLLGIR